MYNETKVETLNGKKETVERPMCQWDFYRDLSVFPSSREKKKKGKNRERENIVYETR